MNRYWTKFLRARDSCSLFKLKIDHIFQDLLFFSKIGDRIWAGVFIFSKYLPDFGPIWGPKNHRFLAFSPCITAFKPPKFSARFARGLIFFKNRCSNLGQCFYFFQNPTQSLGGGVNFISVVV